jgi:hypothetical protein
MTNCLGEENKGFIYLMSQLPQERLGIAIGAQAGAQMSWGQCPCFRWSIQVHALGGKLETRDFLISTDAFFKYQQTENAQFQRLMSRLYTIGTIEALWKGGHIGVGFDGLTVGGDLDRSYSDIVKTGMYVLVNLVATDAVRLNIRNGYDFEQMKIVDEQITRHRINEQIRLDWNTGRWSGNLRAGVYIDPRDFTSGGSYSPYAGISTQVRMFSIGDLQAALGLNISADRDPMREAYGLAANNVTGQVFLDLSWIPGPLQRPKDQE